ncbi:MAG: zinc-ribbon domain-containing protein [Clostridia bacterium]|jgi:very-short-patch-repair endonuclease|nr:zinc-ribbon domain-containing protein [Clostridia bacterium]
MVKLIKGVNDLATLNPELASQWHPTKNGDLTPDRYTCGSNKKVWWVCSEGHEWKATIASRSSGVGCPFCKGLKALSGINDLSTVNPELAAQWHPTKNGNLTPNMVKPQSNKKAWWICPLGHEWEAIISSRTCGNGCPICSGDKVLKGYNDLATTHPKLASEWHPTKNGNKTPEMFSKGSHEKAWWICPKGHEWQAVIYSRVTGNGCPKCDSESKTSFPEQAIYYYLKQLDASVENRKKINNKVEVDIWIPSKNIAIEYDGCRYHVGKKNDQKEQKKNEYLKNCGIRLIRVKESLDKNIEIINTQDVIIFPIKNNYIQLNLVINSTLNLIFNTGQCDIDINRDRGTILESYKQDCLKNSLASLHPQLVKEWHPTKNGTLTPQMFEQWSHEKAWWICPLGHEWRAVINSRSNGNNCPICANKKVLSGFNDLATLRPDLAAQWHPTKNGDLTPDTFTVGSDEKAWWMCPKGHEWQDTIAHRSSGRGCPICAGKQVLIGYNDLTTTHPELAAQWHPTKNGSNTPEMFSKGSHQKSWWTCPLGHEWQAKIQDRSRGSGCPICAGRKPLNYDVVLSTNNPKNSDIVI